MAGKGNSIQVDINFKKIDWKGFTDVSNCILLCICL